MNTTPTIAVTLNAAELGRIWEALETWQASLVDTRHLGEGDEETDADIEAATALMARIEEASLLCQ